jgi:hypothetical protein
MKIFALALFLPFALFGQQDALLESVKKAYKNNGVQCSVLVHIEVPGLKMPDKKIFIKFAPNQKPVVKGDGMMLVPKKGLIGQFNEVLDAKSQVIFLGNDADTAIYKVVSLDPNSDWVTADLRICRSNKRIYFMDIFTKEYGSFQVRHTYKNLMLPTHSTISFEADALKLPLKFMGRGEAEDIPADANGKVKGRVFLRYTDIIML